MRQYSGHCYCPLSMFIAETGNGAIYTCKRGSPTGRTYHIVGNLMSRLKCVAEIPSYSLMRQSQQKSSAFSC